MKQRKTLARRTPLKPGKSLDQHTELRRGAPLRRTREPKAKPNGPVKARRPTKAGESAAERHARDTVWARAARESGHPLCEVCGQQAAREYQHRKAKVHCTRAERWAPSNGLAVCGHGNLDGCHGRIHQNPIEAQRQGWTVLSCQDPLVESVVRRGVRVRFDNEGGIAAEQGSAA